MTDSLFSEKITRLESAFRCPKLSEGSLRVYFEKVRDMDSAVWVNAVEYIIEHDSFFPSIARLLEFHEASPENYNHPEYTRMRLVMAMERASMQRESRENAG